MLHGRLLLSAGSRRLRPDGGTAGTPLWSQDKVAGEYLPRWLTAHGYAQGDVEEEAATEAPSSIEVAQPLSDTRAEAAYLYELGRRYRIDDASLASLDAASGARATSSARCSS